MSDYDELQRNLTTAAAQDLKPLVREGVEALGLENEEDVGTLGALLARAWMDGAQAGQAEVVAQAVEQGANVNLNQVRAPRDESD